MPRKRKTTKPRLQRVSIRAERREEPDWDRFAWVLLQYTKLVSARQAAARKPKGKPARAWSLSWPPVVKASPTAWA